MKYYWRASTIGIKTASYQDYVACLYDEGGRELPLNDVNVGKEFLLIQKFAFRQQAFPKF